MTRNPLWLASFVMCLALAAASANGLTVAISASLDPPVPVGTMVTFTAAATDDAGGAIWYRFRVHRPGFPFQMIRDYGPVSSLDWTAVAHEGIFEMEVSARNLETGSESSASILYPFQSRVTNGQPGVSPTANSLVFLYSAPPCAAGGRMKVQFTGPDGVTQQTPFETCHPRLSMNFYLAGLKANTAYAAHHILDTGSEFLTGPDVTFTTGALPDGLYTDVVLSRGAGTLSNPFLLGSPLGGHPVVYDLDGNVVWYGPDTLSIVTRPEPGGEMWGLGEVFGQGPEKQFIRKYDLAGMTLLETNAARVNEQLAAMGKRQITGFHHEVRTLRGGRIAALAGVEQILTDVQGPGDVDVLGDMIVVLDQDLKVVWTWDTFDNLDVHRPAVLGETCPGACPPTQLAKSANDWTHGNSIQETPDGNLLYSTRHQDWLVKIAYQYGDGDGHVLWRMGKDGDFTVDSTDPFPWFSHQHDGSIELADPTKLLVFDDGNTRVAALGSGNSRGQVYQIDEKNMMVTPVLNADLGVYAVAVGSAQHLRDGNYHFDAGFVLDNNVYDSYSFEVDASGQIQYDAHQNVVLYRTFRMTDMYSPN